MIWTHRDPIRARARLTVGTWLSFDESARWVDQLTESRQQLIRLIPFLPKEAMKPLPSLLDLHEVRGECVRQGDVGRLILQSDRPKTWWGKVFRRFKRHQQIPQISRRLFSLVPGDLSFQTRQESFEASLHLLDHFEAKRRTKSAIASSGS